MEVQLAVLADAANIAQQGKLNILGVFDTIWAANFPAVHPSMVVALRLRLEYGDGAGDHDLEVVLQDEDGKESVRAKAVAHVRAIAPGEWTHLNHILTLTGTGFGTPGRYSFRVRWDGVEKTRVDLKVLAAATPPA